MANGRYKEHEYYFRDDYGNRFYATLSDVYRAFLELNQQIMFWGGSSAKLNDFYTFLGVKTTIEGDFQGWDALYLFQDWETIYIGPVLEEVYIGDELTFRLYFTIPPSMDYMHPELMD